MEVSNVFCCCVEGLADLYVNILYVELWQPHSHYQRPELTSCPHRCIPCPVQVTNCILLNG